MKKNKGMKVEKQVMKVQWDEWKVMGAAMENLQLHLCGIVMCNC
jgi:hypothetical protein